MASFDTVRFGTLEYAPADVITLPDGLIGMHGLRRWLILDMDDEQPMKWFQSLDRRDFGVPVMAPHYFADAYEPAPSSAMRAMLKSRGGDDLVALVITTVHTGGARVTANLRAPLMIDTVTRLGVQMTLDDDRYAVQHEIDYFKFGLAVAVDASENAANEVCGAAGQEQPESVAASL
jgi:flagellar assembly factor FliW